MKVARDEYERGLLFWDADVPPGTTIAFFTRTSDDPGAPATRWDGPLTDPQGSTVLSSPLRWQQLTLQRQPAGPLPAFRYVRWERAMTTAIWHQPELEGLKEPRKLAVAPDEGFHHRLVVSCPNLDWRADTVLRVPGARIALIHGSIGGYRISAFDRVEVDEEGRARLVGGKVEQSRGQGRVVEILAQGSSREDAMERAESILGILALILGEQVMGETIFNESYEVTDEREIGLVNIPVRTGFPTLADEQDMIAVDLVLPGVLGTDRLHRARLLALRWYQRGLADIDRSDRFFSHFIGIETLVNTYAAQHGPVPEAEERRSRFWALLSPSDDLDAEARASAVEALARPTLAERFRFYAASHRWDTTVVDEFRSLARARNDAFHGDPSSIDESTAYEARKLLERMLKAELGILGDLPSDKWPRVFNLGVFYSPPWLGWGPWDEPAKSPKLRRPPSPRRPQSKRRGKRHR